MTEETQAPNRSDGLSGHDIVKQSIYFKPWHRKIARLTVLRGMRPAEIADHVSMDPTYISRLINHHPLLKNEIARLERLLEDKLIDTEVQDFVREEFQSMLPTAMEIIRENIGDIGLATDGKADNERKTKDAWNIIERLSPTLKEGEKTVNVQLQLNQIISNNEGKDPRTVINELTHHIRESKALKTGTK